jgi:hypothetical protein
MNRLKQTIKKAGKIVPHCAVCKQALEWQRTYNSRAFKSTRKQLRNRRDEIALVACLVLISEGVDFATHEFVGDIVFIGRTQSNQIVLDDSTVSAQHGLLLRVGDSYWLKDLNSTNGTQINGVFVTDAELKDGDTIRFGSVIAVFEEGCPKPSSSRGTKMFGMNISV